MRGLITAAVTRLKAALLAGGGAALIGFLQAGVGAVLRTLLDRARDTVSVKDFGAVIDGVTDDTAAWVKAITFAKLTGAEIWFPPGRSLINGTAAADLLPHAGAPVTLKNGIVVPYTSAHGTANRVVIRGAGASSVLVAGSDKMILLRYADSHGSVSGVAFDGNGHTDVVGLAVVPENMQQTVTNVYTIYNVFRRLYMTGLAEAIYLTYGPKVAGSDSGCYYNRYDDIHVYSCLRGIYAPPRTVAFGGGVGRNTFTNVRIGQNCNTGVQIEAGGTNNFVGVHCEGIALGATPNATPTAFIFKGVGNNFNHTIGCHIEACTRDYEIDTTYTYVTGGSYDTAKCLFTQKFRTSVVDGIQTAGFIGAGILAPLAPFHLVTPAGADFKAGGAGGGLTFTHTGTANDTWVRDCANSNGQHIWRINGATYLTVDVLGTKIAGRFACNGSTPQPSFALGATATDLATVLVLANNMRSALRNNGIGS